MKRTGHKTGLLGAGQGLVARVVPPGSALMKAQEKLRSDQGVRRVHGSQTKKFISPSPRAADGATGPEDSVLGCTIPCAALPDSALPGSLTRVHELQKPSPGLGSCCFNSAACEAEEKQVLLVGS